jgi:hypothetical protein
MWHGLEHTLSCHSESLSCRMNRSACHSKLAAYGNCIEDCQHVAELLQKAEPAVMEGRHPDPARWKRLLVKALTRRSAAQAHIGTHACMQTLAILCYAPGLYQSSSVTVQSALISIERHRGPHNGTHDMHA